VFTVAKLLPLLLLSVAGAFAIDPANLRIAQMPSGGAVASTSILLIFSFAGVESALIPGGEMKDPARTVPRALLLAMLAITVLYIWLQIVAQGVLGAELPGQSTPLAEAAGRSLGAWGRSLLLIGASVSMFGYVGGMTLAAPRALYAFGRDGFLPAALARVHPAYRTPYVAIATQAIIACALAVTNTFEKLAILANVAALVLYAACAVAAWRLRRLNVSEGGPPFRMPGGAVIPWLAVGVIAWMLTPIKAAEWAALLAVLAVASAVFAATRRRRAVAPAGAA
jgi:amino acid transporter